MDTHFTFWFGDVETDVSFLEDPFFQQTQQFTFARGMTPSRFSFWTRVMF